MGIVYSRTDTGILVAEHGAGREAVADALRRYDQDLRLVPSVCPKHQRPLWRVYHYNGPDRPATFLLAWQTAFGEPLPLSMRLLDMVVEHDRNSSRAPRQNEDEMNRRLVESRRRQSTEVAEEIGRDMAPRMRPGYSAVLHRGQHLRRSRDKQRARGENV